MANVNEIQVLNNESFRAEDIFTTWMPGSTTGNSTEMPSNGDDRIPAKWIAFSTLSIFVLMVSIYFVVSLCTYLCVLERRRSVSRKSSSGNGSSTRHPRLTRYSNALRRLCVGVAIIVLCTAACGLAGLLVYSLNFDLQYCENFAKAHHALRSTTEILLNSILWLRQKIFYLHPAMRHLTSPFTTLISWAFYIIMIISTALSFVTFLVGYKATDGVDMTCMVEKNELIKLIPNHVVLAVTITLLVTYRVLFLGLLIYPLIKHSRQVRSSSLGKKHAVDLMSLIKRVLVADCLCISIFITVSVLTSALYKESVFLLIVIWEGELVLGFIFVMLSFVDWRRRLFPFCNMKQKRQSSSQRSTRTTIWSTSS
uniref:uncharacterized protein LOC108949716 n=1 Tax=Ciona intestinalis TaxID=7719 RepID=UPI000180D428|nr:uncharacterized protein LOC108949716 [Ciona intestinalis]|eukprot:XP_018668603.2 uncharacterized protein LOC108949716 [Ciona intestinalis]